MGAVATDRLKFPGSSPRHFGTHIIGGLSAITRSGSPACRVHMQEGTQPRKAETRLTHFDTHMILPDGAWVPSFRVCDQGPKCV
jgi:hypothetical protein